MVEEVWAGETRHGTHSLACHPRFEKIEDIAVCLAALYEDNGALDKAVEILKTVWAVRESDGSVSSATYVVATMQAMIYEKTRRFELALEVLETAWSSDCKTAVVPNLIISTRLTALYEHSGCLDRATAVLKTTWGAAMAAEKFLLSTFGLLPLLRELGTALKKGYEKSGHTGNDLEDLSRSLLDIGGELEDSLDTITRQKQFARQVTLS